MDRGSCNVLRGPWIVNRGPWDVKRRTVECDYGTV